MSKYNITMEIEVSNIDSANIKDYVKDIRNCVWDTDIAAFAIIKDVTYERVLKEEDKEIYNMAIADMKRELKNCISECVYDNYISTGAFVQAISEVERKCIKI